MNGGRQDDDLYAPAFCTMEMVVTAYFSYLFPVRMGESLY